MKKIFGFLFVLFLSSTGVNAQTYKSVYTSLSDKGCKTVESNPNEGGSYLGVCPGIGGYKLQLTEGDLRQTINVIAPNKKVYNLDFQQNVTFGFSAVGQKAEWRVTGTGKKLKPVALIIRLNASANPEKPETTSSFLVVAKIMNNSACITDVVEPSVKNQNAVARELADASTNKPCKVPPQD